MSTAQIELPEVVKDYVRGLDRVKQDRLLMDRLTSTGVRPSEGEYKGVGCLVQVAEGNLDAPYGISGKSDVYLAFDFFCGITDPTRTLGEAIAFARTGRPAPNATAILRTFILELRAQEIVGKGSAEVPVEPSRTSLLRQLVAVGLALLMVLVS